MNYLFSPIAIGSLKVCNRIVCSPAVIGAAAPGGFTTEALAERYLGWSEGGVGLIVTEPLYVHPVAAAGSAGLYDDLLIPELARIVQPLAARDTPLLPLLTHAPLEWAALQAQALEPICEQFVAAAWRARAAGCAGVMVNGADATLLHQIHSPLTNRRADEYGGLGRLGLATAIVETIRRWLGPDFLIGYRLVVDELRPAGISLHESRVGARQLVSAGVDLLDVVVAADPDQLIAYFPGWQIPLVESIRAVVDVPLIANGGLGDAELAESILAEGSADLIGLNDTLDDQPDWPVKAAQTLYAASTAIEVGGRA